MNKIKRIIPLGLAVLLIISLVTACNGQKTDAYSCVEDNSHAIDVNGDKKSYDNISVVKNGNGEGDEADFYGTNAAVIAQNGGTLDLNNSKVSTDGAHANAVYSYGDGSTINVSNSTINTSNNCSGGIMVTGGGNLNAKNLTVNTQGRSSAAIRSDRGGGVLNVEGGTYKSYGLGSPAIYSTANITVNDATLYSDISQAVVVEGKNSVTLNNVDATGKHTQSNGKHSNRFQGVMIYQSMSGDASTGKSTFNMDGGSLTALNGGMFFVTNTACDVNLKETKLNCASDDLIRVEAAGWGKEGSNGGQATFTVNKQNLQGSVTVDAVSTLNLILKENSNFDGKIDSTGETYVDLSEGSKWSLTGDSHITSLTCDKDSINLNGYTLTVGDKVYTSGTESIGTKIDVKQTESSSEGNGDVPPPPPPGDTNKGSDIPGEGMPGGNMPNGDVPPPKPDGKAKP